MIDKSIFDNTYRNKKEQLLKLSHSEKSERRKAKKDFIFYLGECEHKRAALLDRDFLGQSWMNVDDLDYVPSQIIDNKIKPLIHKQARFMFGKSPDILFKPYDKKYKDNCEELRQYIDAILNANKFWSNTLKAFRLATVTKRVLLRLEANPNQPVKLFYHSIDDFSYKNNSYDSSKLKSVTFVREDSKNKKDDETNNLWYRYTYYMNSGYCHLKTETYKGDNLDTPIDIKEQNTRLSKIPCWVIVNEQSPNNIIGCSDIKDLKPLQNAYNRRLSDFNDALRFLLFGQTVIIDGDEDDVNKCNIAPNSLMAIKSINQEEGTKQAQVKRVESGFSNAEPIKMYLQMLDDSMHEKLAIPTDEKLKDVPSAKTIKYIYTELVARCGEKWNDWEPTIRSMLRLIVEACSKFHCYSDWNHVWDELQYSIVINKNYPIPEDEEDAKRLAMEEVVAKVRSHKSYIKDYSDDEDYEEHFNEILQETSLLQNAQDSMMNDITSEIDDIDNEE